MADTQINVHAGHLVQAGSAVAELLENAAKPPTGAIPSPGSSSPADAAAGGIAASIQGKVASMSAELAPAAPQMQAATSNAASTLTAVDQENAARLAQLGGQAQTSPQVPSGAAPAGTGAQNGIFRFVDNKIPGTDPIPPAPSPNAIVDPDHPFVGDERFGQWENYTPPPYVGSAPPPPRFEHRPLDGVATRPGGPSNSYTPGRTWIADDEAPFVSESEKYKFRISGQDLTSYTRTVNVNGQQQLQRWVGYTYDAQRISSTDGGGDFSGLNLPKIGAWQSITPNQIANMSALNPDATYYIPNGCGGQFTFSGGVPTGGLTPPPSVPIMTRPR